MIYIALIGSLFIAIISIGFVMFSINSMLGSNDLPTSRKVSRKIVEIIRTRKPNSKMFYDLGSCRGFFAISIKKYLPKLVVIGIDDSLFRIIFSRVMAFLRQADCNFVCGNIFKTDLRDADIVYAYLPRELMPDLEDKLLKELDKGTLIITNTTFLPNVKPIETFRMNGGETTHERIFVYLR